MIPCITQCITATTFCAGNSGPLLERCIRDCVPACREQGKVVKSTTLRQSPKDTQCSHYGVTRLPLPGVPYSNALSSRIYLPPTDTISVKSATSDALVRLGQDSILFSRAHFEMMSYMCFSALPISLAWFFRTCIHQYCGHIEY
ncbi:hypothetical protein BDR03DRAFT_950699 [Suillus americanus]|nr:hypothetical protein BDR03DRAFT_950699 [Suillus americanus]